MTFAYADPPYVGKARKFYAADEVDHQALVDKLVSEYPDGWALSCSAPSLHQLLPMVPSDTRIMAWVKPFAIFKKGVNPSYAWEPVLVRGGRKRGLEVTVVKDFVSANITLQRGLVGAKPDVFCEWLFKIFGARPGDTLIDLFPGTGTVTANWERYLARLAE